jgi:hypothetical protein
MGGEFGYNLERGIHMRMKREVMEENVNVPPSIPRIPGKVEGGMGDS